MTLKRFLRCFEVHLDLFSTSFSHHLAGPISTSLSLATTTLREKHLVSSSQYTYPSAPSTTAKMRKTMSQNHRKEWERSQSSESGKIGSSSVNFVSSSSFRYFTPKVTWTLRVSGDTLEASTFSFIKREKEFNKYSKPSQLASSLTKSVPTVDLFTLACKKCLSTAKISPLSKELLIFGKISISWKVGLERLRRCVLPLPVEFLSCIFQSCPFFMAASQPLIISGASKEGSRRLKPWICRVIFVASCRSSK